MTQSHAPDLWKHLFAGSGAGCATTVILHPIELVKVRLQAQEGEKGTGSGTTASTSSASSAARNAATTKPTADDRKTGGMRERFRNGKSQSFALPKYSGTWDAFRSIVRVEGWRGLYSGLAPSVVGSGVAWGLYFMAYNGFKQQFRSNTPHGGERGNGVSPAQYGELTPLQNLICAAEAGAMVTLLTNPIWVLKTRLQLQLGGGMQHVKGLKTSTAHAAALTSRDRYTGMRSAISSIWNKEGLAGFYRGLWPSLLLVAQGSMQLMAYETLTSITKSVALYGEDQSQHQMHAAQLSSLQIGAIGACSKLFATFFTYPLQVLRTRLQKRQEVGLSASSGSGSGSGSGGGFGLGAASSGKDASHALTPKTTLRAFQNMVYKEGLRGMYRGMVPNLMRTMPQSAITFMVYEKLLGVVRNI